MPRDDPARVLDILLAAREALEFIAGLTYEQFLGDRKTQSAVALQLEIMGEAARAVSPAFRDAHPEVPWSRLVGLRNRIVHEYFRLDLNIVWEITQRELVELIDLVGPIVPPDKPGDSSC